MSTYQIYKKAYNFLSKYYHTIYKYIAYFYYMRRMPEILAKVKSKPVKKVVFVVIDISMWKSEKLFKKLLDDPEFEPYIMSFFYPFQLLELKKTIQSQITEYCKQNSFPMIDGYDFDKDMCINFQTVHPDIVFYAQPYNGGYKEMRLESVWKEALFAYIPYCLNLESNMIFYSNLYQNICWKSYCATIFNKDYESKCLINKGVNMVVAGHPLFDEMDDKVNAKYCWKINDNKHKKIIWAPHHTITAQDCLSYSNFLDIADYMLQLAEKYQNDIEIAFKPHPILKTKLYQHPEWGKNKTDEYYAKWSNMSNTLLAEGSYVDLFLTSDAMVHDSASFTCEYLYTCKPVLFIAKNEDEHRKKLNELGIRCFNLHYHARTVSEIESFIRNVINEFDPMKTERLNFKNEFLKNKRLKFDEYIYQDLKTSLH